MLNITDPSAPAFVPICISSNRSHLTMPERTRTHHQADKIR